MLCCSGEHYRAIMALLFFVVFFQSYMLPLFSSGLFSYLVRKKGRTSRRVVCKRDNSHFLNYVLISPDVQELPFG